MNVLVTGSEGFIGKNLIERLNQLEGIKIFSFDKGDSFTFLESIISKVDFIFHFAGVNRPKDVNEFYSGNTEFTEALVSLLEKKNRIIPVLMSSSIQADSENDYGRSKKEAENHLKKYSKNNNVPVYIYRLPNVFGKWCRPNYNSVIATWCYNIAREIPITVSNEKTVLNLVYIDDVIDEFIERLQGEWKIVDGFLSIPVVYKRTLGDIKDLLYRYRKSRQSLVLPNVGNGFEKDLYSTYLSYLREDDFSYTLKEHSDDRGSFYEILKILDSGQISVSTTKPGVTRGNHYHHTKTEKFIVVKGEALIRQRKIDSSDVIETKVTDKNITVVDIVPGYTHSITNTGTIDLILIIWANEVFDKEKPDTYFLKV